MKKFFGNTLALVGAAILVLSLLVVLVDAARNTVADGRQHRQTLGALTMGYERAAFCDDAGEGKGSPGTEWACPIVPEVRPIWGDGSPTRTMIAKWSFWPIELMVGLLFLLGGVALVEPAPTSLKKVS